MLSKEPAERISKLNKVKKVGYVDYHIWILVENESDLLECEKVHKKRRLDYNIVTSEKEMPANVEKIE
jgi:hypothetical protein